MQLPEGYGFLDRNSTRLVLLQELTFLQLSVFSKHKESVSDICLHHRNYLCQIHCLFAAIKRPSSPTETIAGLIVVISQ